MRCRVSCPDVPPLGMTQVLERVERISDGLEGGVETVANYELFVGASLSLPAFVFFRLDTCLGGGSGGGALTLYLCDDACIDPASPADPANAGRATVVSADSGTAVAAIRMPPYVLYAAVATPASSSSSWVYSLAVAATNYAWRLEANPYLSFRAPMGSDGTAGFTVLWSPLYIVSPYDGSFSLAVGALYTVVVLTGSSAPSDVVNTTVCGVYDTITGHGARTYNTGQLNMTVTGLTVGASYSVAVVATCNAQCLAANNRYSDVILNGDGVAYPFAATAAVPAVSASNTPSTTSTGTSTATHTAVPSPSRSPSQSVGASASSSPTPTASTGLTVTATPSTTSTASSGASSSTTPAGRHHKKAGGLSPGATAGVVIVVLLVVAGGAAGALFWWRRRGAAGRRTSLPMFSSSDDRAFMALN